MSSSRAHPPAKVRRLAFGAALSLGFGCHAGSNEHVPGHANTSQAVSEQWCDEVNSGGTCTMYGPSLFTLIARPEIFNGKRVRVIGYVHFEFEGDGLYVSRESYEHSVYRDGLWIDAPVGFGSDSGPSRQRPNDRYVIVEATFSANHQGHLGMWSGALQHVTRLEAWDRTGAPRKSDSLKTLTPGTLDSAGPP